ncbi:prepilin-type N-terminal cleavage/methylation domain-containing protein [Stenotrophomonas maltophilia]|nr:prepilin-type N-terminal cleavage/methylation domain-containing protein [Stenotrophomonas maltophilia]
MKNQKGFTLIELMIVVNWLLLDHRSSSGRYDLHHP